MIQTDMITALIKFEIIKTNRDKHPQNQAYSTTHKMQIMNIENLI
jgi:hypothetical protein